MESEQSLKVSEDRAVAVKQALLKRYGIEASRITAKGLGATSELYSDWHLNNVVLFYINKKDDSDIQL